LVKRCGDGDPEAWRAFLSPLQEIGRRALRSFRLPPADADDILAHALASLYAGSLAQFRGATTAELVAFLKTVVRNRAIDVLKHRNRWVPTPSPGAHLTDESTAALGVADDECVEFLRHELTRLKREDRELYLMKARGLKEREIAEQTRRPPGTIASDRPSRGADAGESPGAGVRMNARIRAPAQSE
jgi:DNA-directed RNA polymerase specialized sigma24 family protein